MEEITREQEFLIILIMIFGMLLLACGQSINQSGSADGNNEEPVAEHKTSASESKNNPPDDTNETEEAMAENRQIDETKPNKEKTKTASLSELIVHYIDAVQADATLFQFSDQDDSYTILYDTGDWIELPPPIQGIGRDSEPVKK